MPPTTTTIPKPSSSSSSPSSSQQQQNQGIDITTLPTQQLSSIQKQLQQDVQHLSGSFTQLRGAQAKFRDCVKSIGGGGKEGDKVGGLGGRGRGEGTPILVPLTSSLYVPGKLADPTTVLVDVGTGFYVEKSAADAKKFYTSKIDELGKNLGGLEGIVKQKDESLRLVEEVLRQKVLSENAAGDKGALEKGDEG